MRGLLIVFEGPDGCGKTTQHARLAQHLYENVVPHTTVRLPGGSAMGDNIRSMVLGKHHEVRGMDHLSRFLLILADMRRAVYEVIEPALEAGDIVLCDRYIASTIAYQVHGCGLNESEIHDLLNIAVGGCPVPDFHLVFDAPDMVLDLRTSKRGDSDVFEDAHQVVKQRIREFYRTIEPMNLVRIDSNKRPEDVFERVLLEVMFKIHDVHSQNLLEATDV